ncbi:MAG: FAD/NAD(P)-binding protein [Burkholderiales bacterium]|nr:MAG: FAD/NAD(P)-binding protein [Burkholderiales bacterium]
MVPAPAVRTGANAADPYRPVFAPVARRVRETADVVTLEFDTAALPGMRKPAPAALPGRFDMLYAFGVGEIPVSISGIRADDRRLLHTIRAVGPVSAALTRMRRGEPVGIRGPFGRGWPLARAAGHDLLVIAGGIGMAPLRPVIHHAMEQRASFGRVALLYGARTPQDLLYTRELQRWRREPGLQVRVAVDRAGPEWEGDVGLVTRQLAKVRFEPHDTVAMVCGPEIMIRMTALALGELGVAPDRVYVSMERNMKCALGHCGHCQFGPSFVCKDGPVFAYSELAPLMTVREL